jgi:5'(3')-deoxyribonucleotidase
MVQAIDLDTVCADFKALQESLWAKYNEYRELYEQTDDLHHMKVARGVREAHNLVLDFYVKLVQHPGKGLGMLNNESIYIISKNNEQ